MRGWRPQPAEYERAVRRGIGDFSKRLPEIREAWKLSQAARTPAGQRYLIALELIRQQDVTNLLGQLSRVADAERAALAKSRDRYDAATQAAYGV